MSDDGKTELEKAAGKAKGGIARRDALSPEQRRSIAVKAAAARWGEKPIRATHRGNFQEEFGFDVECYVLDDDQKTAVISQRGMGAAVGLTGSGLALPRFLRGAKVSPHVGVELTQRLTNPLVFQWLPVVSAEKQPPSIIHGYDVTILIDICKVILAADEAGDLQARHRNLVKQAHVILNASAKSGIKNLVYALAGYDPTRAEVIAAFKLYVRDEAREYEKEFPDQLYAQWYRLYDLPKPERNKPWKFRTLTLDHVYKPLANSNGKLLELTRAQRARNADRRKKLHQFLSEVGVKALRTHLGQLLGIAQVSDDRAQYERHVERIFGSQLRWDW